MKTPLVSIGIPTYNRVDGLKRAVNSVLAQDYEQLEIVISDNASTDGTERYCRDLSLQDHRVRVFRQQENSGPTPNFRLVLDQAQGEFFMWLADDDWFEDNTFIRKCADVLLTQKDISMVGGLVRYSRNDSFLFQGKAVNLLQDSAVERVRLYYAQVAENGVFYSLMRREDVVRVGIKNRLGGDWLFVAAMAYLGKIRTLETTWLNRGFTWRPDSFERIVKAGQMPGSHAKFPYVTIATQVFRDISWDCPIYGSLNSVERFSLGTRCAQIILHRLVMPQFEREFVQKSRTLLPESWWIWLRRNS